MKIISSALMCAFVFCAAYAVYDTGFNRRDNHQAQETEATVLTNAEGKEMQTTIRKDASESNTNKATLISTVSQGEKPAKNKDVSGSVTFKTEADVTAYVQSKEFFSTDKRTVLNTFNYPEITINNGAAPFIITKVEVIDDQTGKLTVHNRIRRGDTYVYVHADKHCISNEDKEYYLAY